MKKMLLLVVIGCLVPCVALCSGLKIGESLPVFTVEKSANDGRVVLDGDNVTYAALESGELTGKVRSILYMAARKKASDINTAYSDKLKEVRFPADKHQAVVVFNMKDTSMFEKGPFRKAAVKRQKESPTTMYVIDGQGAGKEALGLKEKSYAVILVGKDGKILAYKDGKLSPEEVDTYMELIKSNM